MLALAVSVADWMERQRGHDQQKDKQREGFALFADGIQASPLAQVHITATSFPLSKTSGFTCVPPNVVFLRGCFPLRWCPVCREHLYGTLRRWSHGGAWIFFWWS